MNAHRSVCALAALTALTGCYDLTTGLGAAYVVEAGTYKIELDDRAGTATVVKAVAGEPLVLELDMGPAEVVSALPFKGRPDGGWEVLITLTDFSLEYALRLERRVVSDFSTPNHCTFAESVSRGGRVPCRFFVRQESTG